MSLMSLLASVVAFTIVTYGLGMVQGYSWGRQRERAAQAAEDAIDVAAVQDWRSVREIEAAGRRACLIDENIEALSAEFQAFVAARAASLSKLLGVPPETIELDVVTRVEGRVLLEQTNLRRA